MATFDPAFDKMIRNEGGFKLTNIAGDRGGQTYAGIARNVHPDCGEPTCGGIAASGCNYSPCVCETCGACPCDGSC